jgi:3-phenylpropionate/trans-cinnamate dioxygenase ferredoxin subunit
MSDPYVTLARTDDLPPGKMVRASHDGRHYLLANVDGTVYAVDDQCSHEDASLYKGSLHGDCVRCPLHGSRFDLKTGAALDEPAETPINTYAVRIRGDAVEVAVGRD